MNTKERIIQALEDARGEFVSGESLAQELGMSRNAVWKWMNGLKKAGYSIESVKNRGYRLSGDSDIISKAGIVSCLKDKVSGSVQEEMTEKIYVYDDLDSTNTQAERKVFFDKSDIHKTIVVAKTQSSGRGHRGSSFDSPEGGIYLSIVLDPGKMSGEKPVATTIADIVTEVLKEQYGIKIDRKKDSSLYTGKEKICGILTEAVVDLETGVYSSYIAGIGIRADIIAAVTSESGSRPSKNQVIAALTAKFAEL